MAELIRQIRLFLLPPLAALAEERAFELQWSPEGFGHAAGGRAEQESERQRQS